MTLNSIDEGTAKQVAALMAQQQVAGWNYAQATGGPPPSDISSHHYDAPIAAKLAVMQETMARLEQYIEELQNRLAQTILRLDPPSVAENNAPKGQQPPSSMLWRVLDGQHDCLRRVENSVLYILNGLEV